MEQITAYKCLCGKKYYSRSAAKRHEDNCKCWSNPEMKTCKTCELGMIENNSSVNEKGELVDNQFHWECHNPLFEHAIHYNQAPNDKTGSLCIHCPVHEAN